MNKVTPAVLSEVEGQLTETLRPVALTDEQKNRIKEQAMSGTPNLEFVIETFREFFAKTERGQEIYGDACIELHDLTEEVKAMKAEKAALLKELVEIARA